MDRTDDLITITGVGKKQIMLEEALLEKTSRFVKVYTELATNMHTVKELVTKIEELTTIREFSGDPTKEMQEISDLFQNNINAIQKQLFLLKQESENNSQSKQANQHNLFILQHLTKVLINHVMAFKSAVTLHSLHVEERKKGFMEYGQTFDHLKGGSIPPFSTQKRPFFPAFQQQYTGSPKSKSQAKEDVRKNAAKMAEAFIRHMALLLAQLATELSEQSETIQRIEDDFDIELQKKLFEVNFGSIINISQVVPTCQTFLFQNKDLLRVIMSFIIGETEALVYPNGSEIPILSPFLPVLVSIRSSWEVLTELLHYPGPYKKIEFYSRKSDFVNSVAMVQFAIKMGCDFYKPFKGTYVPCIAIAAARKGSITVLEWVRTQLPMSSWCTTSTMEAAAAEGQLDALKYLRSLQPPCPWDERVTGAAAYSGHLGVLQWLCNQRPPCPISDNAKLCAVRGGHIHVLNWLNGLLGETSILDELFCPAAAGYKQLDMLRWLRAHDPPYPWDEMTCVSAAEAGCIEVLKWARDQQPPCPWSEECCQEAAGENELETLKWLRSQSPPCPWDKEECYEVANLKLHEEVCQWIQSQPF